MNERDSAGPGEPRSHVTPASTRNPAPTGRAASSAYDESRRGPSVSISAAPRSQIGPSTGPSAGRGSTKALAPVNHRVAPGTPAGASRSSRTNGNARTAWPSVELSRRASVVVPVRLV